MFIDQVKILIQAGSGGRGCQSFYRDKYTRKGIPSGGDGGKGADILIRADRNLHTLLDFQYNRQFLGPNGSHGSGQNKKGKGASPLVIRVPCGTTITDSRTKCILRDLIADQDEIVAAYGGKGGLGNKHHREATEGETREPKELILDLKLIADVGVVGFPNAGKSTLISGITNAHPRVAAYPFTTKSPVLGVVRVGDRQFVMADLPGLIEGASCGRGLGDRFLRHVERTRILVHLVDMAASDGRDPVADYRTINQELRNYSQEVYKKPQILVANKMDLAQAKKNLARFKQVIKKKIYPVSALEKEGLEDLIAVISKKL